MGTKQVIVPVAVHGNVVVLLDDDIEDEQEWATRILREAFEPGTGFALTNRSFVFEGEVARVRVGNEALLEAPDMLAHRLADEVVRRLVRDDLRQSIYNVVRDVLIAEFEP